MASPIPPIPPISALWRKLRPQEERARTAEAIAKAPDAAKAQVRDLLIQINNVGHPHGMGHASEPAVDAGARLQELLDRDLPLSLEYCRSAPGDTRQPPVTGPGVDGLIEDLWVIEKDLRRQLGATTDDSRRRELQETLTRVVRLQRFRGPATE
ncbi:hypothetical protein ACIGHF_04515 [Stenotrophomonas sp. NPDC077464]|uniref:hypothetical protein n=1 Tax=unclassified Stenotrophomonas TaxID=196198 RepID=UPI0037CF26C3